MLKILTWNWDQVLWWNINQWNAKDFDLETWARVLGWVGACDQKCELIFMNKEIDLEPWPCAEKYQYFGQWSLGLFAPVARGSWEGTKDSRGRTSYPVSGSSSTYSVSNCCVQVLCYGTICAIFVQWHNCAMHRGKLWVCNHFCAVNNSTVDHVNHVDQSMVLSSAIGEAQSMKESSGPSVYCTTKRNICVKTIRIKCTSTIYGKIIRIKGPRPTLPRVSYSDQ